MSFDPSKPAQTRDGRPVRILCTDANSVMPIVALISGGMHGPTASHYHSSGRVSLKNECRQDLVNVDEFAKPGRDIVSTRDGRRAWVLTRDSPWASTTPIVAIVEGDEHVTYYKSGGAHSSYAPGSPRDLIL